MFAQIPQIHTITRALAGLPSLRHPSGQCAIGIMIPDPESESGIALGSAIRDMRSLSHAPPISGIMDVIWRGERVSTSPAAGPSGKRVRLTTTITVH